MPINGLQNQSQAAYSVFQSIHFYFLLTYYSYFLFCLIAVSHIMHLLITVVLLHVLLSVTVEAGYFSKLKLIEFETLNTWKLLTAASDPKKPDEKAFLERIEKYSSENAEAIKTRCQDKNAKKMELCRLGMSIVLTEALCEKKNGTKFKQRGKCTQTGLRTKFDEQAASTKIKFEDLEKEMMNAFNKLKHANLNREGIDLENVRDEAALRILKEIFVDGHSKIGQKNEELIYDRYEIEFQKEKVIVGGLFGAVWEHDAQNGKEIMAKCYYRLKLSGQFIPLCLFAKTIAFAVKVHNAYVDAPTEKGLSPLPVKPENVKEMYQTLREMFEAHAEQIGAAWDFDHFTKDVSSKQYLRVVTEKDMEAAAAAAAARKRAGRRGTGASYGYGGDSGGQGMPSSSNFASNNDGFSDGMGMYAIAVAMDGMADG